MMTKEQMKETLLVAYSQLQHQAAVQFNYLHQRYAREMACRSGCDGCCSSLFDITLLDARVLQQGLAGLDETVQADLKAKAKQRLNRMAQQMELPPDGVFGQDRPAYLWPDVDRCPCPLLDEKGRCSLYVSRPLVCRLHGLPLIDLEGVLIEGTGCSFNFVDKNPQVVVGLRWDVQGLFAAETALVRQYTELCTGQGEIDTVTTIAHVVAEEFHYPKGA